MSESLDEIKEKMLDEYPEPLNFLLVELVIANEEYWLNHETRKKTYGAAAIRNHGLTYNQQRWADTIADSVEKSGGDGE